MMEGDAAKMGPPSQSYPSPSANPIDTGGHGHYGQQHQQSHQSQPAYPSNEDLQLSTDSHNIAAHLSQQNSGSPYSHMNAQMNAAMMQSGPYAPAHQMNQSTPQHPKSHGADDIFGSSQAQAGSNTSDSSAKKLKATIACDECRRKKVCLQIQTRLPAAQIHCCFRSLASRRQTLISRSHAILAPLILCNALSLGLLRSVDLVKGKISPLA